MVCVAGSGWLFVDKDQCPVLWDQSCGYVWDDTALDKGIEQLVKLDDHGPDAKRHAVMAARGVWWAWMPELGAVSEPDAELLAA